MNVHEIKPTGHIEEKHEYQDILNYTNKMIMRISETRMYEGKRMSTQFSLGYLTACTDLQAYLLDLEKAKK